MQRGRLLDTVPAAHVRAAAKGWETVPKTSGLLVVIVARESQAIREIQNEFASATGVAVVGTSPGPAAERLVSALRPDAVLVETRTWADDVGGLERAMRGASGVLLPVVVPVPGRPTDVLSRTAVLQRTPRYPDVP